MNSCNIPSVSMRCSTPRTTPDDRPKLPIHARSGDRGGEARTRRRRHSHRRRALSTIERQLFGCGHNRRVQEGDPSVHGETDAFRKAGRQRRYRDTIMVTTLAPCWYCSGLVGQFRIGTVVVGESRTFQGGIDWLRERGVEVVDLALRECGSCSAITSPRTPKSGTRTSANSRILANIEP